MPTVFTVFDLAKKPAADALQVEVYGQQWWWEYRYDFDVDGDGEVDEIITANDLVIPTDRPIALRIKSRDVIHSWWAPALNGKKDAVPGRTHPLTIEAAEPGEYIGQCTEFCGLSHAEMRIKVVAMEPDEFQAWAENQIEPVRSAHRGGGRRRLEHLRQPVHLLPPHHGHDRPRRRPDSKESSSTRRSSTRWPARSPTSPSS